MNNSQWDVEIKPKCEDCSFLFVTAEGKVRPCMWISEKDPEKDIFDNNINYNMNYTPFDEIVNIHIKTFVENIKKNPYNALKICFYECTSRTY